ncbi:hypothetical protein VTO42DRAFT_5606 [Malbranchea cinnamomea]
MRVLRLMGWIIRQNLSELEEITLSFWCNVDGYVMVLASHCYAFGEAEVGQRSNSRAHLVSAGSYSTVGDRVLRVAPNMIGQTTPMRPSSESALMETQERRSQGIHGLPWSRLQQRAEEAGESHLQRNFTTSRGPKRVPNRRAQAGTPTEIVTEVLLASGVESTKRYGLGSFISSINPNYTKKRSLQVATGNLGISPLTDGWAYKRKCSRR